MLTPLYRAGLLLTACLLSHASLAQPLEALAHQPIWLKLGHYYQSTLSASGYRSYVDDPAFFLSPEGAQNPAAELAATLELFQTANAEHNSTACRYPARYRWLQEQGMALATFACPEFEDWQNELNAERIVLAFPAAYMNSPSSLFGHTFLRFDPADMRRDSLWLSWAVNFGATVDASDGSVLYAWNGIVGGYPGHFAMHKYYRKLQEYNRLENRDIWEYELNLSPAQVAFISAHIWELQGIRFDYYFFDENCSFRLLELLELAEPDLNLTEGFDLAAIPVDTVRAVLDQGLVANRHYRPANANRLKGWLALLTDEQQRLAHELARTPEPLQSTAFKALDANTQARILQAAYKYQRYLLNTSTRTREHADHSLWLLQQLNRRPQQAPLQLAPPVAPELGHATASVDVGAGYQERLGGFAEFSGRLTYHDLLDNRAGFPQGAEISMGEIRLRAYEQNYWRLEQLDLINIRSLSPRDRFFDPLSWQITTGLERQTSADNNEALVAHINGGSGGTWNLGDTTQAFALATTRLEHNPGFADNLQLAAGVDLGLMGQPAPGNWKLEYRLEQFLNGQLRQTFNLAHQFELTRQQGLRLGVQYRDHAGRSDHALQAAWRWYF